MSDQLAELMGVVLLVRNGDEQGSYNDPDSFTASGTTLTALGALQQYKLGESLRALYITESSSSYIRAISTGLFNPNQVEFVADGGSDGNAVYDSSVAMAQGMWQATTRFNSSLANGTFVYGPLGGYQFIPIDTVDPNVDVSLEGWTSCNVYNDAVSSFYNSQAFSDMESANEDFMSSLQQYLGGREVSLDNMWNVYNFMNEQYTYNGAFAANLPDGYMEQARALANWQQYNTFTDKNINGIGNIAGRTVLPTLLTGVNRIADNTDPLMMVIAAVQHEPFLSIFNMTGLAAQNPELAGVVDYASVLALEVRDASFLGSSEPVVRLRLKNGTEDFVTWPFLGQSGDIPVSTVLNTLWPAAINDTADWCSACSSSGGRVCVTVPRSSSSSHLSAIGAGFLGVGATAAACALALGALLFFGILTHRSAAQRRRRSQEAPAPRAAAVVRNLGQHVRRSSIAKVGFEDNVPLEDFKGDLPAYHQ